MASSLGHQMSGPYAEGGIGPCSVRSNASWIMVTKDPSSVNRQTDTTENVTFLQLRWWAVNIVQPSTPVTDRYINFVLLFICKKVGSASCGKKKQEVRKKCKNIALIR